MSEPRPRENHRCEIFGVGIPLPRCPDSAVSFSLKKVLSLSNSLTWRTNLYQLGTLLMLDEKGGSVRGLQASVLGQLLNTGNVRK